MKKLFLGAIAFALIVTSCNKYANDFQALKDQISALSLKVDGVAALQAGIDQTKSKIDALSGVLDGKLATITTNIGNIQTALNSLATNGATAASVLALKVQLEGIIAAKAISDAALDVKIAAITTKVNAAATSAQLAAAQTELVTAIANSIIVTDAKVDAAKAAILEAIAAGNDNVLSQISGLQALVVAANATNASQLASIVASLAADGPLQSSVDGLTAALAAAQHDLAILLASAAMYNDNVTIYTDFDVDFFYGKINQIGIINGNLTVNTDAISGGKLAHLNEILNAVVAIIGNNAATYVISAGHSHHHNNNFIVSVVNGAPHSVTIESAEGNAIEAHRLKSVVGDYTVTGADIADIAIDNVGGNLTYEYSGDYESTSLTTVGGNLSLVDADKNISFPNVVVTGFVDDNNGAPNTTVVFSADNTLSINFGLATKGQINSLTSAHATSITLGTEAYTANTAIFAPEALTIDLSAATSTTGSLTIASGVSETTGTATTVDLSGIEDGAHGAITVWAAEDADVKLDMFNSDVAVSIRGVANVTIPAWEGNPGSNLNVPETTTLTLASYRWWSYTGPATIPSTAELASIETLTLGNALETVHIDEYPTLVKAVITGATIGDDTKWATISAGSGANVPGVHTTGNANLDWLQVGGLMNTVDAENLPRLHAFATSGVINTVILDNADSIVSLGLGHNAFVGATGFGGPGSDLWIKNNLRLASLTTSTDWLLTLQITGNAALASFDLSSYTTQLSAATLVAIDIDAPAASYVYVDGIAPTGAGNPGVQAIIKSNDLMTLKPYLEGIIANDHVNAVNFSLSVGDLTADMNANDTLWGFSYHNLVTGGPIDDADELGLVVAN